MKGVDEMERQSARESAPRSASSFEAGSPGVSPEARAYQAPRLTYLGTVYELTLTGSGSTTEGGFPKPAGS
jgi:hypothetical protein